MDLRLEAWESSYLKPLNDNFYVNCHENTHVRQYAIVNRKKISETRGVMDSPLVRHDTTTATLTTKTRFVVPLEQWNKSPANSSSLPVLCEPLGDLTVHAS
jgi:hypothetical protein